MSRSFQSMFILSLALAGGVGACDREPAGVGTTDVPPTATHVLDDAPLLVLGDEPDPLHEIRGGILQGQRVVIAEASTNRLLVYDREGRREYSVGGTGRGPGEFARLWWVQGLGEGIYAYDLELRRITRFSGDGQYVDDTTLSPHTPGRLPWAIGVFEDSSILVEETAPVSVAEPGVVRAEQMLWRVDWEGDERTFLGTYHGSERFVEPRPGGGARTTPLPLGKWSGVVAQGLQAYVIENHSDEIRRIRVDGEELGPARPSPRLARRGVHEETLRLARDRFVHQEGVGGDDRGARFDAMPVPDSFPYYGGEGLPRLQILRATSDGRIWILRHDGFPAEGVRWLVFDQEGQQRAEVVSRRHLDILDSDGEYVLVRRWSDVGEEFVELRRIMPVRD